MIEHRRRVAAPSQLLPPSPAEIDVTRPADGIAHLAWISSAEGVTEHVNTWAGGYADLSGDGTQIPAWTALVPTPRD